MSLTVQALDHLVVQVSNVNVAAERYARALGMTREDFADRGWQGAAHRNAIRPPEDQSAADRCKQEGMVHRQPRGRGQRGPLLLADSTPEEVVRHLHAESVAIVTRPGLRQGALMLVYCRDPDGSLIEIACYVEG